MAPTDIAALIADPGWLAHRYDRQRDEIHFVWMPREARRAAGVLTAPEIARAAPRRIIPRRLLAGHDPVQAPLHIILHSGLTGSTLLGHALDRPGVATTLSEPPILTDVVSCRMAGVPEPVVAALLDDVLGLLARPFAPGEAVIVKAGNIGNVLGGEILARRPSSRALCLHASLPLYLASIVRKGLWGRIWGRKLFSALRSARMTEMGFDEADLFEHSDLQIAAGAWLALHRVMAAAARRHGECVRATTRERLTERPAAALAAIAAHFGLALDGEAIAGDPLFQRHSKSGEAFDPARREAELCRAAEANREEIDMVVTWARSVAQSQGIGWDLPGQLDI